MRYHHPVLSAAAPVHLRQQMTHRLVQGLAGLGDLGDLLDGSGGNGSMVTFRSLLESHISGKAGPEYLANAKNAPSFAGALNSAAATFRMGESNTLPPAAQAYWNQWRNAASDPNSDYNIYWMFGSLVSMSAPVITSAWAAQNQQGGWWLDACASQASYTLMDSSTSGTNWMGGTTTASKLTNSQWGTVFVKAWTIMQKGITNGVLPLTYLDIVCRGMLQAPAARKMPLFQAPPGNLAATDPKAIAFRACLKQLGYNDLVKQWYGYTAQAWAAQSDAQAAQDATYGSIITGLEYLSGKAILDQITRKLADYWNARTDAAAALRSFDVLAKGPLKDQVPQADRQVIAGIRSQFLDTDSKAYTALSPFGLWPADRSTGNAALNGLGALQLVLAGTAAIVTLGLIAYIVTTMTATARDAAAQTRKTTESILATVDQLKKACATTYTNSAKDAAADDAYTKCLMSTKTLTDTIPPVPASSSDPFGFGKMAMLGAVVIGGIMVMSTMKK